MTKKKDFDIEDELDSFCFDDEDPFHTRDSMREQLIKQRDCDHQYYTIFKGDFPIGMRCKCGYQLFI